jgi:hypothetical protein
VDVLKEMAELNYASFILYLFLMVFIVVITHPWHNLAIIDASATTRIVSLKQELYYVHDIIQKKKFIKIFK